MLGGKGGAYTNTTVKKRKAVEGGAVRGNSKGAKREECGGCVTPRRIFMRRKPIPREIKEKKRIEKVHPHTLTTQKGGGERPLSHSGPDQHSKSTMSISKRATPRSAERCG